MNKNNIYEGNKIIIKNNLLFSQMEKEIFEELYNLSLFMNKGKRI